MLGVRERDHAIYAEQSRQYEDDKDGFLHGRAHGGHPRTIHQAGVKGEYNESMEKIKIEHHTLSGGFWIAAWFFTIGYLNLSFWQGVLAVVLWPYYIGAAVALLQ